jgi:RNA polymerase sigma factor (sigma-70 family)
MLPKRSKAQNVSKPPSSSRVETFGLRRSLDRQLAQRGGELAVSSDDRSWFDPLVRSLGNRAVRFALVNVGDLETAQDIVQEAFARCWASASTPSAEADFQRWLYRVIVNLARDYHRRRVRFRNLSVPPPVPVDPIERMERQSEDREVLAALRTLSLRERQAIYLRYFEDQSFADAARIMGSPQVSVRVLVHRALGKLRHRLEDAATKEVLILEQR